MSRCKERRGLGLKEMSPIFEKRLVPIYVPIQLYSSLTKLKRVFIPPARARGVVLKVNIRGERDVEWTFLSTNMPDGPGKAIDFGCEAGHMSLLAAQKGYHVLAVDLQDQPFTWSHPSVEFAKGDFLKMNFPRESFDLAINCSSVEHVGVAGRYGILQDESDGDIQVIERLAAVLKPGGLLLMTAPCGKDSVMAPWCRVYGPERLPVLLAPFEIVKEAYWVKNSSNQWAPSEKAAALNFQCNYDAHDPHECLYALGCFVLRKTERSSGDEGLTRCWQ
jgi:SAM-dependent methyltransferase